MLMASFDVLEVEVSDVVFFFCALLSLRILSAFKCHFLSRVNSFVFLSAWLLFDSSFSSQLSSSAIAKDIGSRNNMVVVMAVKNIFMMASGE